MTQPRSTLGFKSRAVSITSLDGHAAFPGLVLAPSGGPGKTVILAHGRDGAADAPHMAAIASAYGARGWTVVAPHLRFSAANPAPGETAGFTMAAHLSDFRATLCWATSAMAEGSLPDGPIALAGHSMGAYAAACTAAEADAAHLLAVSPVLSGNALIAARTMMGKPALDVLGREVPLAFEEWPEHDAAPALGALTAPVGVIVGGEDGLTPPRDARAYFAAAKESRYFAVAPGQHHCPEGKVFANLLSAALDALGA